MQQLQARELESELHKLKAKLAAAEEAARGQPSDTSLEQHFAEWQMFDSCLQELKQLDDTSLKAEFSQFADIKKRAANSAAEEASTDAVDKCCLSKQGLAALFAAKNKTLSEGELEELISRSDANGDGVIDFNEFRTLVRSTSDLEMIFKSLPLAQVLAFCFPKGSAAEPLAALFNQQHSEVDAAMGKAGQILTGLTMSMIEKNNKARVAAKKQQAAGGAKYGAELKGATVEKFFEGVTGICGEPNPGVCVGGVVCVGGDACVCVCVCVFACV
jgi:hypothetical protein